MRGLLAFFRPISPRPAPHPGRAGGDVRDAVISLRTVPEALEMKLAASSRRESESMSISDAHFEPRVAVVAAGTPLGFRNTGRLWHGAFSVAAAARFDLGKLSPGSTDRVTFPRAGLVTVHCDLHPQETGYVMVIPHHAFTRPDARGGFSLPKLAPGEYELVAWHPDHGTRTRRLTVAKRGDVKCDLVF
jgi:plastocyanin